MDEKKSTPIHTEGTELEVSVEGLIDEAMVQSSAGKLKAGKTMMTTIRFR